jgi:hypothetical protein
MKKYMIFFCLMNVLIIEAMEKKAKKTSENTIPPRGSIKKADSKEWCLPLPHQSKISPENHRAALRDFSGHDLPYEWKKM